jgi:hypothetical protein
VNKVRELGTYYDNWFKLLLWFLAKDSEEESETTSHTVYVRRIMPENCPDNIEEQFKWFVDNISGDFAIDLSNVVVDNAVPPPIRYKYLPFDGDSLVVNSEGKEKLKGDWPEIWNEFNLGIITG